MTLCLSGTVIVLAVVFVQVAYRLIRERRLRRLMPPGPSGAPLLGNVFQVPKQQWLRLSEWKDQYGTPVSPMARTP